MEQLAICAFPAVLSIARNIEKAEIFAVAVKLIAVLHDISLTILLLKH